MATRAISANSHDGKSMPEELMTSSSGPSELARVSSGTVMAAPIAMSR